MSEILARWEGCVCEMQTWPSKTVLMLFSMKAIVPESHLALFTNERYVGVILPPKLKG